MSKVIEISDDAAEILDHLRTATGRTDTEIVDMLTRADWSLVEARRTDLRVEIARRLKDDSRSIDASEVFAELRAIQAARFGKA
jgi:hypothetical protein